MRIIDLHPIHLGVSDLSTAFDRVFKVDTLRAVHGSDLVKVTPWVNRESKVGEKRKIVLHHPLRFVPEEVRCFVNNIFGKETSSVKMTSKQTVNRSNLNASSWQINTDVSISSIGSNMLLISPTLYLERRDGQIYLSGRVEHSAFLPSPWKKMVEDAMARETQYNLDKYVDVLTCRNR